MFRWTPREITCTPSELRRRLPRPTRWCKELTIALPLLAICWNPSVLAAQNHSLETTLPLKATSDLTLNKDVFDSSASYCGGDNILFYNGRTGEGLAGKVSSNGFTATKTFRPGDILPGWTYAGKVDSINSILFYKQGTGEAALGTLDHGNFRTTQTYTTFSHGWTSILYVGLIDNHALFYDSTSGSAVLGFAPATKTYRKGDFAAGWTHIVWNPTGALFYDADHGSGAIAEPIVRGSFASFAGPNDLETPTWLKPGSFTTQWTHVAATQSHVLFYNRNDGSAAIGTMSRSGFETRKEYQARSFAPQWTHMVSTTGNTLLFYNAATGSAAIGEILGDEFRTTKEFVPGSFAPGFSLVVCSADSPAPPH